MTFFRRWSFTALLIVVILSAVPMLFSDGPETIVAPPFARPLWLDRTSPPTMTVRLEGERRIAPLDWSYSPPRHFELSGRVVFDEDPGSVRLLWRTPSGDFILADLSGRRSAVIDIDARDVAFKLELGLSPFEDILASLFPEEGRYSLELVSDVRPSRMDVSLRLQGGRWGFLGTDQRGRDVLHLFLSGIRVSLLVGVSATLIATLIGLSLGLASGYLGGLVDGVIMRGVDVLLSIPILPIMMVLAGIWGKGLWQLVLILSIFSWMGTARTVRSMTLSLRDACYIENLRALGAPSYYILFRHLLPETLPLLLASIALGVPGAILAEASLSFLGLSDPRVISWGRMLHEAHSFGAFTAGAWWLLIPPGLGIVCLCLIFLDIGKFLEEQVDPQLRRT